MKNIFYLFLVFVASVLSLVSAQERDKEKSLPQIECPKPKQGVSFQDPVFKTALLRLTDAQTMKYPGLVPDYSKRQAWNCDETLLMLRTGEGSVIVLDGKTYQLKKVLPEVGGEDVFWHPTNPSLLYYNPDRTLYLYNIEEERAEPVYTFLEYTFANTRGEGNLSRDGKYYAVVGQFYDETRQEVFFRDFLLLDILSRKILQKLSLPKNLESFDWISVSSKGNYIVVDYADTELGPFHGIEVYDTQFRRIWQKPLGAGHSDLGMDENGDEILVMDIYNADTNSTFLKKFRLADGEETTLLEFSYLFDAHISCQNEVHLGWCFVSTFDYVGRLTDSPETWLPFEDEIFALKLDGTQKVTRLAHHHSRRYSPQTPDSDQSVYFAEPHATINRQGNRLLFGSNWRQNIKESISIDTYLLQFDLKK
ncbi:MAG: hypothetical protein AABZ60_04975 [Planctomycetota bacterium]